MSLTISLDTDHTRMRVEVPSGHTVSLPFDANGAAALQRLLLAQKRADVAKAEARIAELNAAAAAAFTRAYFAVGTECSPTQQELDHIAKHEGYAQGCPFCRDEARRGVKVDAQLSDFD